MQTEALHETIISDYTVTRDQNTWPININRSFHKGSKSNVMTEGLTCLTVTS